MYWNVTTMQEILAEYKLEIYKKIIRELIDTFELDEETIDVEPLPASIG
jgi:hypothetical protein